VPPGSSRRRRAALLALLALALAVRLAVVVERHDEPPGWDERFNVANVVRLVERGRLEPANHWYGGASYVPQALLVGAAQAAGSAAIDGRRLRPLGTLLTLLPQAAYGVLSLAVAWLVGRRLLGPRAALLGVALLAASPRHLHASVFFKPDILLLLATLSALLLTLRAARRPTAGSHLAAGVAIGLAVGTKLNGAPAALPLALATAVGAGLKPRRWLLLGLAAAAALATYLAFNPDLPATLRAFGRNLEHYEERATEGSVLGRSAGFLLDETFQGPLLGGLGLAGLGLLAARVVRRARRRGLADPRTLAWLLFLAYPVAYALVYATLTSRAKANHLLQVLPFGSLLAAWVLVAGWALAARRVRGLRRWQRLAVAALALWVVARPVLFAYQRMVPTTGALAAAVLQAAAAEPRALRYVVAGDEEVAAAVRPELGLPVLVAADDLAAAAAVADGVVVRATPEASGALARGPRARLVARAPLSARGPGLLVAARPLRLRRTLAGLRPERAGGGVFTLTLPDAVAAGELVSVTVAMPGRALPAGAVARLDGSDLRGASVRRAGRRALLTERVRARRAGAALVVRTGERAAGAVAVDLHLWAEP
jgi:4-amino-4-deoxy-L-arabinose transferase-like glycosyltransferase